MNSLASITLLVALAAPAAPGAPEAPDPVGHTRVTVAVVRVRGGERVPERDALVRLEPTAPKDDDRSGTSGADGTVTFDGVPVLPGGRLTATTVCEGVRYESAPAALQPDVPAGLVVEVFDRTGDPASLRIGQVMTEVFLWEGKIGVEQTWRFVNPGDATWDAKASTSKPAGLELRIPERANGLRSKESPTRVKVAGAAARFVGTVRPGQSEDVSISWYLPYEGPSLRFVQPAPLPIDRAPTAIPEVPVVRNRRLEGVRMTVGRHEHERFELERLAGGHTFWIGRELTEPGARSLTIEIRGLPHRSLTDAWIALSLAVLAFAWAMSFLASRRRAPAAGEPRTMTADPLRADLGADRQRLFEELVALEREGVFGPAARSRRQGLIRELARLDRRLEAL